MLNGANSSLSVVIVTYNNADSLSSLLDALAAGKRPVDEVIVVDNASADSSARIARDHPAVDQVVQTGRNAGFAEAANIGASHAIGDLLCILNPDLIPEAGFMDAIREAPAAWAGWMGIVLLPDGMRVNTDGGVAHYLGLAWSGNYGDPPPARDAPPREVGFLSGACLVVRRPMWVALGGFPNSFFMYAEDLDLSHRIRLSGGTIGAVPAARVRHDYEFDKGQKKWFLLERNRWLVVLRTYPGPLLRRVLPVMLLVEPALLAISIRDGWWRQKLRSYPAVIGSLPAIGASRREIQRRATITSRGFAAGLDARLNSPFMGSIGSSRLANRILASIWRVIVGSLPPEPPRGSADRVEP